MSDLTTSWQRYFSPHYLAVKLQENGIVWCLRIGSIKILHGVLLLILFVPLFIPSYILYLMGVRFLPVRYLYAIGHLAAEPDCYLKEGRLGLHPNYVVIMLAPANIVANRCLVEYWRRYIRIVTSPTLCFLLYPLSQQMMLKLDIERYIMDCSKTARIFEINNKWAGKPPLLSLREYDQKRGRQCLQNIGLPEGAWFVCVHCRQPGNRPQDKDHAHCDVDIYTYILAMEAIAIRGGWCVLMGDAIAKPLPPMPKVIYYANLDVKSDWMDVFLCASCRFLLGSNSGLMILPAIFGIPCIKANLIPLSDLPIRDADIGIPKLLWSCSGHRYLTFKEGLDYPLGNAALAYSYTRAGIRIIDNSPDDIRDVTIEMLDRTEGRMTYTPDDESLQRRFKSLLKPGHYGYGASSRIGRDFLRKYISLLPEEGDK
ncbi:MAG: TIGR04372 family glycosyltransferase [Kiritimatiellae bacterium]|nr:TIGR04372 family glycosyltransferase [Kiritimatiellia bacterium]